MRSIANHVGWAQIQLIFTESNISKPVLVSLLAQTSCLQLKCQRNYAYDKIFLRKLKWILNPYYANYYVGRGKCFIPVYWRIMSNLGTLKPFIVISVKMSILFDFQFRFFVIFESCFTFSIRHLFSEIIILEIVNS